MKKHLEVGAKSGREEEKESRSSNFESEYAALSSHNQSPAIADSESDKMQQFLIQDQLSPRQQHLQEISRWNSSSKESQTIPLSDEVYPPIKTPKPR